VGCVYGMVKTGESVECLRSGIDRESEQCSRNGINRGMCGVFKE